MAREAGTPCTVIWRLFPCSGCDADRGCGGTGDFPGGLPFGRLPVRTALPAQRRPWAPRRPCRSWVPAIRRRLRQPPQARQGNSTKGPCPRMSIMAGANTVSRARRLRRYGCVAVSRELTMPTRERRWLGREEKGIGSRFGRGGVPRNMRRR